MRKVVAALGILIGLSLLLLLWKNFPLLLKRDPAIRYDLARKIVIDYLRALHDYDQAGIRALVPKTYEAQTDIKERLIRFGGINNDSAKIAIKNDIVPDVLVVDIQARDQNDQLIRWTENLFWRDERWWFVMGSAGEGGRPRSGIIQ